MRQFAGPNQGMRQRNNFHNNGNGNPMGQPHHNNGGGGGGYYDNGGMAYGGGGGGGQMDSYNYYGNGNGNNGGNLYGGPIRNNFQYGNKSHHNNRYNPINNPSAGGQQMDYGDSYGYNSPGTSNGYGGGYGGPKNGGGGGFHQNQPQQQFHPQQQFQHNNGGGMGMNTGGMGGMGGKPGQDMGGYILFVYNIGLNTDEQMLRNLFTKFGHVLRSNVIRKGNESKGFGFVTMSSERDALNAIQALHGYNYNGKQLQVSFKK